MYNQNKPNGTVFANFINEALEAAISTCDSAGFGEDHNARILSGILLSTLKEAFNAIVNNSNLGLTNEEIAQTLQSLYADEETYSIRGGVTETFSRKTNKQYPSEDDKTKAMAIFRFTVDNCIEFTLRLAP